MSQSKSLWGGRFKAALSEAALRFSSSIDLDKTLYQEDIYGSIAHVEMLAACKILTAEESRRIRKGLKEILSEIDSGKLSLSWEKEDIHMAIEQRLIQKVGAMGGKLHTGRSRNDQVALDERLYLRAAIIEMKKLVAQFQRVLLFKSEKHFGTIMPGYTHLQRAQPILLSHHLLAYVAMLERDYERLTDCYKRVNRLPLGAAALAGTSFPIDRAMVARKLGFDSVLENSIDAVSDRDYIIEFTAVCSNIMMHLSRMSEELVLWTSQEFNFARIDDAYTTGSSIMPQKKNPDMAELTRGKVGRVYGDLMNILTIMKGLPLAYNRDMQEDKQPLFDAVNTTRECVYIMTHVYIHTKFEKERFEEELKNDFLTATEIADYLVMLGVPFRDAHSITGKIVGYCIEHHTPLSKLSLKELHKFSPKFSEDVFMLLDPLNSIEHKRSAGSTSPNEVKKQIVHWTRVLKHKK
ncbi:MAG: argininosuccinate lyase [Bacteriovoracaceae bacterium]|nr:argininosuccinate lyase [Bacteroidota bacterium]